jgi:hypothetical protein
VRIGSIHLLKINIFPFIAIAGVVLLLIVFNGNFSFLFPGALSLFLLFTYFFLHVFDFVFQKQGKQIPCKQPNDEIDDANDYERANKSNDIEMNEKSHV